MLLTIFVPCIGAFLLPPLGWISERLRNWAALALVAFACLGSVMLLPAVVSGADVSFSMLLPLGFNFILKADILALFMAFVSSSLGTVIVFYSWDYISHYQNRNEYYFMAVLFLGSMMGIVFSQNLIYLFLFWEITAITSWRLIGFFREKSYVLKADKSFLITVFGALVMLLGFIVIYEQAGSFDLAVIKRNLGTNPVSDLAVFLVLFGIFSKSATLPFHTWLPDAGVAPSPVTALLHAAVLVKIGVYVYARLFIATMPLSAAWHTTVLAIAAASAIVAAGAALIDTDLKRIIAYSTISQIGFIFLGFGTGTKLGVAGALLYILMHGIAKGGLFLCAGIVEQNTHTKDITKMGGLIRTMPITAVSFLLCAFSVMAIPPFGGFFAKYMVITGAATGGFLGISFVFLVGAFLTIIYLLRVFMLVFLGEAREGNTQAEGSASMIASVALLALFSLIGGLYIYYPSALAQAAVVQMMK